MRIDSASEFVQAAVAAVVFFCWLALAAVFLFKARGRRPETERRVPASIAGIVLQGFGFACSWGPQRRTFGPFTPGPPALGLILAGLAASLAVGSTWLTLLAVRVLGREWSFQARLVEGHRLVTEGPYGLVRHPLYASLIFVSFGWGLIRQSWPALAAALALAVFFNAKALREERWLREKFPEYAAYEQRVRRFVPWIY